MWSCKKCGEEKIPDQWQDCPTCGTGKDWSPPKDLPKAVPVFPFEHEADDPPNIPPLSSETAAALRAVGFVVGLISLIVGVVVISNSPEAPSAYSTTPLSDIARANRVTYLVLGWSQIIGGPVIGLLLYVIGGIGQVVVDLWNEQQRQRESFKTKLPE